MIRDYNISGGDEAKVGYYAGLIVSTVFLLEKALLLPVRESIFFATEALFVLQWSRLSDRIGRKPVLLVGTAGSFLSMMLFGLTKTFWGLVIRFALPHSDGCTQHDFALAVGASLVSSMEIWVSSRAP